MGDYIWENRRAKNHIALLTMRERSGRGDRPPNRLILHSGVNLGGRNLPMPQRQLMNIGGLTSDQLTLILQPQT